MLKSIHPIRTTIPGEQQQKNCRTRCFMPETASASVREKRLFNNLSQSWKDMWSWLLLFSTRHGTLLISLNVYGQYIDLNTFFGEETFLDRVYND